MSIVLFVLHNGPADFLAVLSLQVFTLPSFVSTSLFLLDYDEGDFLELRCSKSGRININMDDRDSFLNSGDYQGTNTFETYVL